MTPVLPAYRSGLYLLRSCIFASNRDGVRGMPRRHMRTA